MDNDINTILGAKQDCDKSVLEQKCYFLDECYREIFRYSDDENVRNMAEKRRNKLKEAPGADQLGMPAVTEVPSGEINGLNSKYNDAVAGIKSRIGNDDWAKAAPLVINALKADENNIIYNSMARLLIAAVAYSDKPDMDIIKKLEDSLSVKSR